MNEHTEQPATQPEAPPEIDPCSSVALLLIGLWLVKVIFRDAPLPKRH